MHKAAVALGVLIAAQFGVGLAGSLEGPGPGRVVASGPVLTMPQVPITISATARYVPAGQSLTLTGFVTGVRAGQQVTIFSRRTGASTWTQEATTSTEAAASPSTRGAEWVQVVTPVANTQYVARARVGSRPIATPGVFVEVGPRLTLTSAREGSFDVVISKLIPIRPTKVRLQRYTDGRWQTVATAVAKPPPGSSPLWLSANAVLAPHLPHAISYLRAFVSARDAGVGYTSAASATLRYRAPA